MATGTTRCNPVVTHRPDFEPPRRGSVRMANLAGKRGHYVGRRRLAQHDCRIHCCPGMTAGTVRAVAIGGMVHGPVGCKAGGAGMADIALQRGRDMRGRFGFHPGYRAVASGTSV